jgi:S1-C subfamily serine protease
LGVFSGQKTTAVLLHTLGGISLDHKRIGKMNKRNQFIVLLTLLALVGQSGISQSAREIAQKSFPSVVMLVMEDANGQPVSLGSGFFVRADVIATNLHVVQNASRGYAKLINKKPKYELSGFVALDPHTDLVLLKVTGVKANSLPLGNSEVIAVGDEVFVVGNPQGLEGTFSNGIVSGIREIDSHSLLQITAPISPGSSGGPVLNDKGKVIGVAVATFKGGQNLNFAIPSTDLSRLITNMSNASPLTELPHNSSSSVTVGDLGERSTEAVVGENFKWTDEWCSNCGGYTFSLRNALRNAVKEVYCLVIFYDAQDKPVDIDVIRYKGLIPGGLARRVEGMVDGSIRYLTNSVPSGSPIFQPRTRYEFRVLDFRILN